MLAAIPITGPSGFGPTVDEHGDRIGYSKSGAAYFVDNFLLPSDDASSLEHVTPRTSVVAAADGVDNDDGGNGQVENAPVTEVPAYESYPNAPNTFYLDFTGAVVTDTDWNADYGDKPIHALPFDKDGDTTTFSQAELDIIYEVWQRVSEDYLPFKINVTTVEPEEPLEFGHRMARAIITHNEDATSLGGTGEVWFPDAGGVAYVGGWVTNQDAPAWVFHNAVPNSAKGIAEAVAHEFGHVVGLSHHGDAESEYYAGHGAGETSWAPIMGAGYRRSVTQWSSGKYAGATNRQDDIEVITNRFNRITFRDDDHAEEHASSLELGADGVLRSHGIIETRSDYDTFSFEHSGGPLSIDVKPAELGGNLDIAVVLFGDNLELTDYNPQETTAVSIKRDLAAGSYTFEVEGIGFLPDVGQGYSDYGSLGAYTIEVRLGEGVVADAGTEYTIDEGTTLTLDATQSLGTDDATIFAWDLDADGEYDDATGSLVELTWEQLAELPTPIVDQTTFQVAVEVRSERGADTAEATVTVANVAPQTETRPYRGFATAPLIIAITAHDVAADPLLFEWDFGDGTELQFTNSATVLHTYQEAGEYEVKVKAGDDEAAITDASFLVTIDAPVPGDADFDGSVTFADFLVLSSNFGEESATWQQGDFDDDGQIGFADFLLLSANFGATAGQEDDGNEE